MSFAGFKPVAFFAKDNNNVYCHNKILDRVDPRSFEVIGFSGGEWGSNYYHEALYKDATSVYVRLHHKVEGADPETFEYLGDDYAKDKNNVFYNGELIEGADPETFMVIEHCYVMDKNAVYFSGEKLVGSDPETFELIDYTDDEGRECYGQDSNSVYWRSYKIEEFTQDTFDVEYHYNNLRG